MILFVERMDVGVDVVRVRLLSSSSASECRERNEPKRLEGRELFCRLLGLGFGINLSMLLFELTLSTAMEEGLGGGIWEASVGELDSGLDEKNVAGRRFFVSILG